MIQFTVLSYNRPNFLEKCLRSLVQQTDPRWSAHVIDVGSDRVQVFKTISAWVSLEQRIKSTYLDRYEPEEAIYANEELERVNRGGVGIYASLCDNAELAPEVVGLVLDWFKANPDKFAGYVTQRRDIWSANGLIYEGPASKSGHWDITPETPGRVFIRPVDAVGQLDHSQVYHRLPTLAHWKTSTEAGDKQVDGWYFADLIRLHGPIHPIAPGDVYQTEHLAWRE